MHEEFELTEAQAKALLASPTPLADVYKDFEKLETSYMDVIRDTIETRANELYQAQEKLKNTPLYPIRRRMRPSMGDGTIQRLVSGEPCLQGGH